MGLLCLVLGLAFWIALAIPFAQNVFDVVYPDGEALGLILAGVAAALVLLTAFRIRPGRQYD